MLNLIHRSSFSLADLQLGSPTAFKEIFRGMEKELFGVAKAITRNDPTAEDIVARAFLKLYECRSTIESKRHLVRWLWKTVKNASIDTLRERKKVSQFEREFSYLQDERFMDVDRTYYLQRDELMKLVAKAIETLPPRRKQVLHSYFCDNMSTQEIAVALNISKQTVLNHKTEAILDIRRYLLQNPQFTEVENDCPRFLSGVDNTLN